MIKKTIACILATIAIIVCFNGWLGDKDYKVKIEETNGIIKVIREGERPLSFKTMLVILSKNPLRADIDKIANKIKSSAYIFDKWKAETDIDPNIIDYLRNTYIAIINVFNAIMVVILSLYNILTALYFYVQILLLA